MREEKERRKREKEKADADSAALAIKQAASAAGATSAPASTTASKGTGPLPPSAEVRETIDQVLKDIGIAPVGSVLDSMDRLPASTGPATTNSTFFSLFFFAWGWGINDPTTGNTLFSLASWSWTLEELFELTLSPLSFRAID